MIEGIILASVFVFVILLVFFIGKRTFKESLEDENSRLKKTFGKLTQFYDLQENQSIKNITEDILKSRLIKKIQKKHLLNEKRQVILFNYPSDGLMVKALLSYIPEEQNLPLLVYLRGGNRVFGLPNPADELVNFSGYNVLSPIYRGGVSEGEDEYGGADINDVKNLINYIPTLEKKMGLTLENSSKFILGASRGGLQMFLTLARFPELQSYFQKAISLSGLLDLKEAIALRPDLKQMFIEDFGLNAENQDEWIHKRDPIVASQNIEKNMSYLIIQGTKDNRVSLKEGLNLLKKLQERHIAVDYCEIKEGRHCLVGKKDLVPLLKNWLEKSYSDLSL